MTVHKILANLKKWIDTDITDSPVRNKALDLINSDNEKSSPAILNDIDGKYSPFRPHLSKLANLQLDTLKLEKKLVSTIYVTLAAVKFKNLLKSN